MTGPDSTSSTADEPKFRKYLAVLLAAVFTMAIGIGGFALWLAPPTGDLVRIGGWSERDYGWQGTKTGFAEEHYDNIRLADLLEGAPTADILVFGDSFSRQQTGGISWINTLHEQTGRSVSFVRIYNLTVVQRYLDSDAFKAAPPAAILVQSVERLIVERALAVHDSSLGCEPLNAPPTLAARTSPEQQLPRETYTRRARFDGFDELMSWGALALRKRLTGSSSSIPISLSRDDLFSSAASDQALIFREDITKHTRNAYPKRDPDAAAAKASCGLRQLFARSGTVPIRFMIAPDKRTIYQPWTTTPLPAKSLDVFAMARAALGDTYIDLYAPLSAAAATGQDIYFSNDSHWGPSGNTIAGTMAAAGLY